MPKDQLYTRDFVEACRGSIDPQPTDAACIDSIVSRLDNTVGGVVPRELVRLCLGAWYDGLRHERVRASAQNRSGNTSPTWAEVQGVFGDMDVGVYSLDDLYRVIGSFQRLYMDCLDTAERAENQSKKIKELLRRMVAKLREVAVEADSIDYGVVDIYAEAAVLLGLKPLIRDAEPAT